MSAALSPQEEFHALLAAQIPEPDKNHSNISQTVQYRLLSGWAHRTPAAVKAMCFAGCTPKNIAHIPLGASMWLCDELMKQSTTDFPSLWVAFAQMAHAGANVRQSTQKEQILHRVFAVSALCQQHKNWQKRDSQYVRSTLLPLAQMSFSVATEKMADGVCAVMDLVVRHGSATPEDICADFLSCTPHIFDGPWLAHLEHNIAQSSKSVQDRWKNVRRTWAKQRASDLLRASMGTGADLATLSPRWEAVARHLDGVSPQELAANLKWGTSLGNIEHWGTCVRLLQSNVPPHFAHTDHVAFLPPRKLLDKCIRLDAHDGNSGAKRLHNVLHWPFSADPDAPRTAQQIAKGIQEHVVLTLLSLPNKCARQKCLQLMAVAQKHPVVGPFMTSACMTDVSWDVWCGFSNLRAPVLSKPLTQKAQQNIVDVMRSADVNALLASLPEVLANTVRLVQHARAPDVPSPTGPILALTHNSRKTKHALLNKEHLLWDSVFTQYLLQQAVASANDSAPQRHRKM